MSVEEEHVESALHLCLNARPGVRFRPRGDIESMAARTSNGHFGIHQGLLAGTYSAWRLARSSRKLTRIDSPYRLTLRGPPQKERPTPSQRDPWHKGKLGGSKSYKTRHLIATFSWTLPVGVKQRTKSVQRTMLDGEQPSRKISQSDPQSLSACLRTSGRS